MGGSEMKWSGRRAALMLAGLAAAAFGLRYALRELDWAAFRQEVAGLDWRWLALAVAFDVLSYVAQGVRWRMMLDGSTVWQTTRAIYAGLFVNELMPLRPGEALRGWLAARDLRAGFWSVAPSMLAERLMDGAWLAAALLAVLAAAPLPAAVARVIWGLASLMAVLLAAVWIAGGRGPKFFQQVRPALRHRGALLVSGGFLAAQGLAFWASARASHLALGVAAAFVVMVVVRLGTMLPGAPANVGTHQFATVMGLTLYGVPAAQAASFSLIVFTVLTLPLLLLGLAACLSAGLSWRGVRPACQAASGSGFVAEAAVVE